MCMPQIEFLFLILDQEIRNNANFAFVLAFMRLTHTNSTAMSCREASYPNNVTIKFVSFARIYVLRDSV